MYVYKATITFVYERNWFDRFVQVVAEDLCHANEQIKEMLEDGSERITEIKEIETFKSNL